MADSKHSQRRTVAQNTFLYHTFPRQSQLTAAYFQPNATFKSLQTPYTSDSDIGICPNCVESPFQRWA